MLRELDVPLLRIRDVLATEAPADQLALIERHWSEVKRSLDASRAARDHLARVLGGWEELLAGYTVEIRQVAEVAVLVRRRRGDLRQLQGLVEESVALLSGRARREGFAVAGAPVSLYDWPADAMDDEHDRMIEVCLPVTGADPGGGTGDAVLPGGQLVCTDAIGPESTYPAVLAGYGAVSQWAHQRGQGLVHPPLMIHRGTGHVRVGWRIGSAAQADDDPAGVR